MTSDWYKLEENERIKEIYTKYSIKDFLEWWTDKEIKVMEVRIKDYPLIKIVSKKLNLPYSPSGVYIWNELQLKLVMKEVRDRATIWFGVNSRKQNWNKFGKKSFGGTDNHIKQIDLLFIDIDRIEKNGPANRIDLENCDKMAELILERLSTQNWNKNYCKICSGNGVQLLIKFDIPIKLPDVIYINKSGNVNDGYFELNEEFEKLKRLILEGVGKDILKFSKKYAKDLNVEVDKSCFNIGRVAALPFTKNFKYGGFTWRGIIKLENGINDGLSDYVLSKELDVEAYNAKKLFYSNKTISHTDLIRPGKIKEHKLIKFMLENELPYGMINNYLIFQLKCLLRDSKIDLNSKEWKEIHKQLEIKVKGNISMNIPDNKFGFDENIVNKYFIINEIIPIYPIYPNKTKKLNMKIDNFKWEDIDKYDLIKNIQLSEEHEILEDIVVFRKQLIESDMNNVDKYAAFLRSCIQKYGEKTVKYYFDYVMLKLLSYE
jgi:hypothetical protein